MARHNVRGIACDIRGKLAQRESYSAARRRRRWHSRRRASGLARWIPSAQSTCPCPTVTDQGATHRHAMTQPPSMLLFPHSRAEKSPQNQHVLSFNPDFEATLAARATRGQEDPAPRSGASDDRAGRPRTPPRRERRPGRKAPRPGNGASDERAGSPRARERRERRPGGKTPRPAAARSQRKRGPRTIGARPPPSSSTAVRWEVGLGQALLW